MKLETYRNIERYMVACVPDHDPAHSREHIDRVLYLALDIAGCESEIDMDVLIAACLLHDIGRQAQFDDPSVCHAKVGGEMAYTFLLDSGWDKAKARHVRDAIHTHRYRTDSPPATPEAKILFDADKLDATGATGIARTLLYKGQVGEPLYTLRADGRVSDGTNDSAVSFFQEYRYKLEGLYSKFYTQRASELALRRKDAAVRFYEALYREIGDSYSLEQARIETYID